jgi:hypothetical protein
VVACRFFADPCLSQLRGRSREVSSLDRRSEKQCFFADSLVTKNVIAKPLELLR